MERSKNLFIKIANIFDIAKKEKWLLEYDADLDSLYWTKPKISTTAKLKKFLEDFSLYITPSGEIQGLFIEYAKYNFISHNKEYESLLKGMKKKDNDKYVLLRKDEKKIDPLLKSMAEKVGNETLEAIGNGLNLNQVVRA